MTLAILGGEPTVKRRPAAYRSVGAKEREAVQRVIDDNCLSGFYGSPGEQFLGGPRVREFEAAWADRFRCEHVVSVNSATSGLYAAIGAVGIGPGDEVIVPPYTMSATAMAPLVYGGIPVFVDIEPDTFCLDVVKVRAAIGPRTRAILVVNLFGHPAPLAELRVIADAHGIPLIEDNAQSPLAAEGGRYAGTIGHIGVFSLNYHKHIHTGEGGMCCTDDDDLADRLRLIRNHAENMVEAHNLLDKMANLVGFNYRMTELSAAVGLVQLADIDDHVGRRQRIAERLTAGLAGLTGITPPRVRPDCRHVYYVWAARVDPAALGVSRSMFARAIEAEGVEVGSGYVPPLYRLPLFRQRVAFGKGGYPFTLSNRTYDGPLCPVAEAMHEREVLTVEPCGIDPSEEELDDIIAAFHKVHQHRHDLVALDRG